MPAAESPSQQLRQAHHQQHHRHHSLVDDDDDDSPSASPHSRSSPRRHESRPLISPSHPPSPSYPPSALRTQYARNSPASWNSSYPQAQTLAAAASSSSPPPPPPPPHHPSLHLRGGSHPPRWYDAQSPTPSQVTPGADNHSSAAAHGGISGVAMSVADGHPRESGIDAARQTPAHDPRELYPYEDVFARPAIPRGDRSSGSGTPLGEAVSPGMQTPTTHSTASVNRSLHSDNPYSDNAYPVYSRRQSRNLEELDPTIGFDPNAIEDDGDDGLHYGQRNKRASVLSLGQSSDRTRAGLGSPVVKGAGVLSSLRGVVGGGGGGGGGGVYEAANAQTPNNGSGYQLNGEKGGTVAKEAKKRRIRWIVIIIGAIIILGAIVGGIAGGVISSSRGSKDKPSGPSAASDRTQNGDLDKNSAEIQALMNNPELHRVFPGIDYTPINVQYPECLKNPPSQNNVTRDMAVLSQLTNKLRLYGTDCNQTEMVLHAIERLELQNDMKVWLGVWQDDNAETNERQLDNMYNILDNYDLNHFLGIVVGNEILFRKEMTMSELIDVISKVKTEVKKRNIDLPVGTSDLGDAWTQELASAVDIVMANIHPFFSGNAADKAAAWTLEFWRNHNAPLTQDLSTNIISEVGWPTQGGKSCGMATTCTPGAVAGIDDLNTFMDSWVCQALANGTDYFWFEAFDEPWKVKYHEGDRKWEDHWGLMTVNRVVKDGVKIPDCGGQTIG